MSFADFTRNDSQMTTGRRSITAMHSGSTASRFQPVEENKRTTFQSKHSIEAASLKLEQFQRQVVAIKRAISNKQHDDDLGDRIRYACLLQEEIAKVLARIPADSSTSAERRKLLKDFQLISDQLEAAVSKLRSQEQATVDEQRRQQHEGRIVTEHDGQVLAFEELDDEIAHNEALIEEREADIEKIHQSVAQVNEIFRDLASIVHQQQEALDDMENNVDDSLQNTRQGLDQVQKASDMQWGCILQ